MVLHIFSEFSATGLPQFSLTERVTEADSLRTVNRGVLHCVCVNQFYILPTLRIERATEADFLRKGAVGWILWLLWLLLKFHEICAPRYDACPRM